MTEQLVKESTQPVKPITQRPKKRGGLGCWITGITTLIVAAGLVAVGLLLPPFNLASRFFGPQYAMLDSNNNAAGLNSLAVIAEPDDVGQEFGVLLSEVPMEQFAAGSSDAGAWVSMAAATTPPNHALQSSVYSIDTTGTAPEAINLSIRIPSGVANADLLDLYAYDDQTDTWQFIPARPLGDSMYASVSELPQRVALFQAAPPSQPRVLVAVDVTQTLPDSVASLANIVAPGGLQPTLDGNLTGSLAPGFDLNAGYLVMPVIRNFIDPRALDTQTVVGILNNRAAIQAHANAVASLAASSYDGVIIDYRDVPAEQRDNFTQFMRELHNRLANTGSQLGVIVPAAQNIDGAWETGAYDWRALGEVVDFMTIQFGPDPSAFVPGETRFADALLRWAVGEVSRDKLLIGLSSLSTRQIGSDFTPIGYDE
ncbi:MAG: hypothetical protein KC547_05430, partial [Anaerolineae bacterium]|nr:hypothetical protein [Anaerolineae bacterium]